MNQAGDVASTAITVIPEVNANVEAAEEPVGNVEVTIPAAVPPAPKSWAALVKKNVPETTTSSASSKTVRPFVVTSEQAKLNKEDQKLFHLGEIISARKLMGRDLIDHRTLFIIPRGMLNRGNACYANAVLQSLVFCPPFFHLLEAIAVAQEFTQFIEEIPAVTRCFSELISSFKKVPPAMARKTPMRSEDPPLDPAFLYETLETHGSGSHQKMLSRGAQEDAQEFLNHVLLLLHEEMLKGVKAAGGSELAAEPSGDSEEWTHISKGQKKSILREMEVKESPISNIFGGKLRSIRKHSGGKDSENVEPFFMLDLPIQDPVVKNVFMSIEYFMRSEKIHGFFDRGREIPAYRHYRFEQLPAVLILHLKYFEYSPEGGLAKLQKTVDFDASLRLPERWFADGHFQPNKCFYKLFAVVFHWGEQLDSGHYTACVFHPGIPSQWIEANDSGINVVNWDYIRSPQRHRVPYLLFYRLQCLE